MGRVAPCTRDLRPCLPPDNESDQTGRDDIMSRAFLPTVPAGGYPLGKDSSVLICLTDMRRRLPRSTAASSAATWARTTSPPCRRCRGGLTSRFAIRCLLLLVASTGAHAAEPPKTYGPAPTKSQLRWHKMEYYGLICYGPNTYLNQGWGYGNADPAVLNPTDLDTDQWAKTARDGGMRGLVLVAKHHDGFCLWPTRTTKYNITASPWKDGKGDLLGDLARSCRKHDLKLGVYISPWDRNHAEYGREQYVKDFHQQWREVLEYDDDIFIIWLDGANGGTGWYGGAKERRTIPKGYYQMEKLFKLCKEKQPRAVFFNLPYRTDAVRWVGNESGSVPETHWHRFEFSRLLGDTSKAERKRLTKSKRGGMRDGDVWMPAEADTPFQPGWFRNTRRGDRSLSWLVKTYYGTVGRGACLDLGLGPDTTGRLNKHTVDALRGLREHLDKVFAVNLAEAAAITADNFRGKHANYAASQTLDQRLETYWATDDGVGKATLEVDFGEPVTFNHLLMQEHIALGQRVHEFHLEVQERGGSWKTATQGTTVGYKKIMVFDSCTAGKARLTLETDAPCLTLATMGLYKGVPPTEVEDSRGKE